MTGLSATCLRNVYCAGIKNTRPLAMIGGLQWECLSLCDGVLPAGAAYERICQSKITKNWRNYLSHPTLVGKALSFTHELSFFLSFFLYQSTAFSSRAVDGHQVYFAGSVVDKTSIIGIEISPTCPLIFIGAKKCKNLASFWTSLNFEAPARVWKCNDVYPNSKTNVQCCDDRLCSCDVWWSCVHAPLSKLCQLCHPLPKLHDVNVLNRQ